MSKSSALMELIQSMSQAEKRYFKVYASQHVIGEANNYVELFDCIEKKKLKNVAIEELLEGTKFEKNSAFWKSYLYKMILKSLRSYNSGKTGRIQINEAMIEVEVLLKKGLLKQAEKTLKRAIKQAKAFGLDFLLLELIHKHRRLIRLFKSRNTLEKLREIRAESITLIDNIQIELEMLDLYEEMIFHEQENGKDFSRKELIDSSIQMIFKEKKIDQISSDGKILYYALYYSFYYNQRDYKTAKEFLLASIEIFENDLHLQNENIERYIACLNNYLNCCFLLGDIEAAPQVFEKLAALKPDSEESHFLMFQTTYMELVYYMFTSRHNKVISLSKSVDKGLRQFENRLTVSRKMAFLYNIALAHFFEFKYGESLDWVNRILNSSEFIDRQDVLLKADLLQLVLHYELDNIEYVDNFSKTFSRKISAMTDVEGEKLLLQQMRKIVNSSSTGKTKLFSQLAERLKDYKNLAEFSTWAQRHAAQPGRQ